MSTLEVMTSLGTFAVTTVAVTYIWSLVRNSGADRAHDPKMVAQLIEAAPYDRLDNILPKKR